MLETLGKDLRFALRMMGKSGAVTAVAVLSLALGLGGVTALFSLIDAVMLRRLPVSEPRRLVVFGLADGPNDSRFSYPLYDQARRRGQTFSDLIAFTRDTRLMVRAADAVPGASGHGGPAEPATGQLVSGSFFAGLGVGAAAGRTLTPGDDRVPGGHPVAVLSYGYWQRRFGSDPAAVGRGVTINGSPFTIVGVARRGFFGVQVGSSPDFFLPIMMQKDIRYRGNALTDGDSDPDKPWVGQAHIAWLNLVARLKPGVEARRARAEFEVLFHQSSRALFGGEPDKDPLNDSLRARITVAPADRGLSDFRRGRAQQLLILMCGATLVLLIACANVANLLLARAAGRRKEVAIRLSIGAARGRLVRQLLTESVLLAGAGATCGLLLAFWGRRLLLRLAAIGANALSLDAGLDLRMLAFAAGACLATALLFGLVPALQATRVELSSTLKEGGRGFHGGGATERSRLPLGKALVIVQVGLSLLLLIGTGLFLRSIDNLERLNTGFARDHLTLVRINPRLLGLTDPQLTSLYQRLLERVTALPGVRSASLSLDAPLSGSRRSSSALVAGYTPGRNQEPAVQEETVTPRYFETVGIQLLEGRGIGPQDQAATAKVAVINETMARHYFAGRSAVGRRFGYGKRADEIEIVGVVRDARFISLRGATPMMAFRPVAQAVEALGDLEVRTWTGPGAFAEQLRHALREVEPNLPIDRIGTAEEQIGRSLSGELAVARLTSIFGILALLLAAIGLYGVMSYGVARRTNEIGLRMALGAKRGTVLGLIFREAMLLTAAGIVIGLAFAMAAAPLAKSQLFGLAAGDPPTLGLATLVLLVIAGLTGLLPAQRAASVNPMVALRSE
ncbi:MAG TPA: ABC transporter permease [Thermoanaerobaculia bacterium]|nr:ABC transporter permease [Thermoanaerobaculia bacterium]